MLQEEPPSHIDCSEGLGRLQWAWWTAVVIAANYRNQETVRRALQLEAQLRCASALAVLSDASEMFSKEAKLAAGKFVLR